MKTSQNGINLIKQFEGCQLTAYKCPAGVWTIGYGHTSNVKQGDKITQAQADAYLEADLVVFEQKVEKYNTKYRFSQNEFDALVSFAYNIGNIDQLTANGTRDRATIAAKMLEYNKASGKVLVGLVRRRTAERDLFVLGGSGQATINTTVETAAADTYAVGDKVKVNGIIYGNGNGTGGTLKKSNAIMYVVGLVSSKTYKYYIGLAATKGGTRQGWAEPSILKRANSF